MPVDLSPYLGVASYPMVRAGFVIALVLALTPATAGAITTTGPTNFPVGTNPLSVRVGNFNADTDPDLATANYLSNNVSILLGNGAGGFTGPTNFAVGFRPTSVAVGDFNRDTLSDLAVTNFFNNTVSILIGNGAGGFSAPTNFAAGAKPNQVAVGNFNADTDPDLAVADYNSNKVSILLGNGLGGFSAPTAFTTGSQPASVTVGRFNGDTNLDLAVANHNSNNVSILLGNGAGGFGAPTNFAAGSAPYSVAAGDLDGDTDADLAVANYGGTVSVLLSNGLGGFTGPTNFAAGSLPYEVAVGDLDGDLDADLTVANVSGNSITVLLGNGLGSFSGPNSFLVPFSHYSVALGDFNRDAAPDFAVANAGSHNVSILLQGQQTIAVSDVSKAEGDTGQTSFVFQVTLAGGGTEPVSVDYHTEDGSATTADSDYTPLPVQTLTFAPGETSKPVTVNVTGDIDFEANENFTLVLSNPVNAVDLRRHGRRHDPERRSAGVSAAQWRGDVRRGLAGPRGQEVQCPQCGARSAAGLSVVQPAGATVSVPDGGHSRCQQPPFELGRFRALRGDAGRPGDRGRRGRRDVGCQRDRRARQRHVGRLHRGALGDGGREAHRPAQRRPSGTCDDRRLPVCVRRPVREHGRHDHRRHLRGQHNRRCGAARIGAGEEQGDLAVGTGPGSGRWATTARVRRPATTRCS